MEKLKTFEFYTYGDDGSVVPMGSEQDDHRSDGVIVNFLGEIKENIKDYESDVDLLPAIDQVKSIFKKYLKRPDFVQFIEDMKQ